VNYLQLVQRLHRESGRSTAAPTTVTGANERHARLFDWVADAWRNLQIEREWRWMRNTLDVALTAGQQTYTGTGLGADRFRRWRMDDDTYNPWLYVDGAINSLWPLQFVQLDEFRSVYVYRTWGDATPIAWTFDEANQLLVAPKPALAYKLRIEYWKSPSELAADTDTPDMPEEFHMLLVWRALQEVAKFDAAPEVLARAEKNHMGMMHRLLLDQARLPHK
jgi:hypothetical protein